MEPNVKLVRCPSRDTCGCSRRESSKHRVEPLYALLRACTVCPRDCGNDRLAGVLASCASAERPVVSAYAPHFGEEPCSLGYAGRRQHLLRQLQPALRLLPELSDLPGLPGPEDTTKSRSSGWPTSRWSSRRAAATTSDSCLRRTTRRRWPRPSCSRRGAASGSRSCTTPTPTIPSRCSGSWRASSTSTFRTSSTRTPPRAGSTRRCPTTPSARARRSCEMYRQKGVPAGARRGRAARERAAGPRAGPAQRRRRGRRVARVDRRDAVAQGGDLAHGPVLPDPPRGGEPSDTPR